MNRVSKKTYLSVPEARDYMIVQGHVVTDQTIRYWCKTYGIGVKVGGRWRVDANELKKMVRG